MDTRSDTGISAHSRSCDVSDVGTRMKITATYNADIDITKIRYSKAFRELATDIDRLDFLGDIIAELTDVYNNTLMGNKIECVHYAQKKPTIDKTP